jgi:indole-3-glycerol phosphate synthase
VIAEIKKASPSKGVLRDPTSNPPRSPPATPPRRGLPERADRPSVLPGLAPDYLKQARDACDLPVLRKDFMIDEYQVYEARAMGADCILLIVACLDDARWPTWKPARMSSGMAVLVESHDAPNWTARCAADAADGHQQPQPAHLRDRCHTTLDLLPRVPAGRLLVTESGILGRRRAAHACRGRAGLPGRRGLHARGRPRRGAGDPVRMSVDAHVAQW